MTPDNPPRPQRHRPAPSPYLGPNREYWLHRLIRHSVERSWCVDLGCTTCGAKKFRDALRTEAFRSAGRVPTDDYDRLAALHLIVALASLNPDLDEARALEASVILAISELHQSPIGPELIAAILEGHWAAELISAARHGRSNW